MRQRFAAGLVAVAALGLVLWAVVPQRHELRNMEDFLKGKFDGISVSSEGLLALAPSEMKVEAPTEEFYLSLLVKEDGSAFLGTGHGGKIYRVGTDGKAELFFQAPEMDVTCLALDRKGTLFAGTSPNGKVYKITEKGKGEEFFNPAERYIWELQFMDKGGLWAAVGETGGIYEISPQGEGRMIFKAEENHVLCLRKTDRGDVVAGSGGNGLVYRISAEGRASVLFETPYEEVRSLALDKEGMVYAAASGTPSRPKKEEPVSIQSRAQTEVTVTVSAAPPVSVPETPAPPKDSGALYRISAEGMATMLWSSAEEMVYSLLWKEEDRRLLFGTGSRGRIYSVDKDGKVSLLLQQSSEQVYLLLPADRKIFVLSNNPCYLGELQTEQRFAGEYTGPVIDAKILSSWGRISWLADVPSGTSVQLQTRSGNTNEPNATWSQWSPPYQKNEEMILSPKARFLQVKIQLRTQSGRSSPVLSRVALFYLQNNVPPAVTRLDFLRPNEVFLKLPEQEDVIMGAEKGTVDRPSDKDPLRISLPGRKAERKGFQTVVWDAADDNGDTLSYTVSMRKEEEKVWRVLQDDWSETMFAFDTLSFPDGTYFFKLTASDRPSNPPGTDLQTEKVGRPFVIDNSLPVIRNFAAVRNRDVLDVSFQAEDSYSYIEEVKFLLRPGEWRVVFPADGIADSRAETFKFSVRIPPGADNLIAVRVKDSFGNVGVHRANF